VIPRRRAHVLPGELSELTTACRAARGLPEVEVAVWERAVASYVGVPHAAAVSSGRRGMELIFRHLGIGAGDEVVVPAYTLKDLLPLIRQTGARVVLADIDPRTLCVTSDTVAARLTSRTRALLVLHTFGAPCVIDPILALADAHGVPVIEDCAHSLGAAVGGRQTGALGYAGFFSFETTKPVNTFGGGMVVSRDASLIDRVHRETAGDVLDHRPLAQKIRAVRVEQLLFSSGLALPALLLLASPALKGLVSRTYRLLQHAPPSRVRYSPLQARRGVERLRTLAGRVRHRAELARRLRSLLDPRIAVQHVPDGSTSTWYFFVVVLPCAAAPVRRALLLHGVDAGIEDEIADDCAALLRDDGCPNTRAIYPRAMALPMYEELSDHALQKIARLLNRAVR
jgi:perosamine synthetase